MTLQPATVKRHARTGDSGGVCQPVTPVETVVAAVDVVAAVEAMVWGSSRTG